MAEIKKEEAMFHDAIKGFLGKREQGLVMGHFRAVLSANSGKVDEDSLSDFAATAFIKWQEKEGAKSVDQCKSFCAGYMYGSLDRLSPTQQAIDAGKV